MSIYLVDDLVYLIYKKKVFKKKFKSLLKGYIINKELFMSEFLLLIKENKIKSKILGNKIEIIFNTYFKVSDRFLMENIFLELGFIKVLFKDIREFYIKDAIYIEVNNTYMVINLWDGIYLDFQYFRDIPRILDYFKNFLDKDIILFGLNKEIPQIRWDKKDIYYIKNSDSFIIESLL